MSEHFIVVGVFMPSRCSDCCNQRFVLQIASSLTPGHSPTAPLRGVLGDGGQFVRRTARKQFANPFRHLKHELAIFLSPPLRPAHPRGLSFVGVLQAFPLSLLDRRDFDENALSLVRFLLRLKRTTTTTRSLAFVARRVKAIYPAGREKLNRSNPRTACRAAAQFP